MRNAHKSTYFYAPLCISGIVYVYCTSYYNVKSMYATDVNFYSSRSRWMEGASDFVLMLFVVGSLEAAMDVDVEDELAFFSMSVHRLIFFASLDNAGSFLKNGTFLTFSILDMLLMVCASTAIGS